MSRFTFRLEQVRALREQAERQAKEALARQLAVVATHESAVAIISDTIDAARSQGAPAAGPLDPRGLIARQHFLDRLERDRQGAELRLAQEEREAEARRGLLEKAAQDLEALERAKQRAREEHRKQEQREADEQLGEVALAAFRRNGQGGAA